MFDQSSKYLVRSNLEPGQSIAIIDNIFHLTYIRNPGAALGILPRAQPFLLIITVVVIIFIFFFQRELGRNNLFIQAILGLFLGGTLGNFIDRLRFGLVTDFLDFKVWPVFNLADTSIFIGLFMMTIYFLQFMRLNKEKDATNTD